MTSDKKKKVFIEGPITSTFIAESIAKHAAKTEIGAHSIFLGQVRADKHENNLVSYINYTAYHELAEKLFNEIRESAFDKYPLTCMHIYHSLGRVNAGEISLFVFTSSPHRNAAINACNEIVERIKKEVPIWGEEFLDDGSKLWKKSDSKE